MSKTTPESLNSPCLLSYGLDLVWVSSDFHLGWVGDGLGVDFRDAEDFVTVACQLPGVDFSVRWLGADGGGVRSCF